MGVRIAKTEPWDSLLARMSVDASRLKIRKRKKENQELFSGFKFEQLGELWCHWMKEIETTKKRRGFCLFQSSEIGIDWYRKM